VDIVYGLGVQERMVEVREDAVIEGDVGRKGIEQDPIAIKGDQFDHVVGALPIGRRSGRLASAKKRKSRANS
jgi:hypothetical protein